MRQRSAVHRRAEQAGAALVQILINLGGGGPRTIVGVAEQVVIMGAEEQSLGVGVPDRLRQAGGRQRQRGVVEAALVHRVRHVAQVPRTHWRRLVAARGTCVSHLLFMHLCCTPGTNHSHVWQRGGTIARMTVHALACEDRAQLRADLLMWLGWLDGSADGMRCGRTRGRGAPREHKVLARWARRDAVEDGGALQGAAVDGGGRAHVHERQGGLGGAVLAHRGGAPRPRGVVCIEAGPAGAATVHADDHRHLHAAPHSSCPIAYLDGPHGR